MGGVWYTGPGSTPGHPIGSNRGESKRVPVRVRPPPRLTFPGEPEKGTDMKFLNDRYAKVFSHKGFDICTLKSACPAKGDRLGYVIDDVQFESQDFELLDDAVKAIDLQS